MNAPLAGLPSLPVDGTVPAYSARRTARMVELGERRQIEGDPPVLKGIDPLLNGDLLKILDDMGHGDELLLVDRNFPARAAGKPLVQLGEVTAVRAMTAILSVFPLDAFVDQPLARMEVENDPAIVLPTQKAVLELAQAGHELPIDFAVIPRFEFYERAKNVYAIVHVLEEQPYSCFILQKGVVFPPGVSRSTLAAG
jgi:L-fucose mutarotase